jgi:hypothetical protein
VSVRRVCIHQPTYLPWLGFFDKLLASDVWVVLDDVLVPRKSWITRVNIRGEHGPLLLSIPILNRMSERTRLGDVLVDNTQQWRRKHLGAITHAYAKRPYFASLEPLLHATYAEAHARLVDVTMVGVRMLCRLMNLDVDVVSSSSLDIGEATGTERLVRLTRAVGGDAYVTGSGSRGYLEPALFDSAGLGLEWQDYVERPYVQGRGEFVGRLSALDAVAELGTTGTAELLRGGHRPPCREEMAT